MTEDGAWRALAHGDVDALPESLRALGRLLFAGDKQELDRVRELARQAGAEAVPLLVHVAGDRPLAEDDSPGNGWAPVHAAYALSALEPREGVERLLDALLEVDIDDWLYSALIYGCAAFGPAVVEPALARLVESDPQQDATVGLLEVLANAKVHDDRVLTALLAYLEQDPPVAASLLGTYGDKRALPVLRSILDDADLAEGDDVIDLCDAIRALGGALTDEQRTALFHARLQRRERWAARRGEATPKLGRNDPCPCDSGRKFKKCHGADPRYR